ncbi:MAG TPA: hypothetical protein VGB55_01235 [Tepidisphaeraceae bacterium]
MASKREERIKELMDVMGFERMEAELAVHLEEGGEGDCQAVTEEEAARLLAEDGTDEE